MSHHITAKPIIKDLPDDPLQVKQYILPNGLKLFFSVNKSEPRIYTEIVVRAGSKHDPADTTGLAHYFEHMMFKGTDKLGTLNWEKEKAILDQIEATYESHRAESDPEKKKVLYAKIDELSFEAAKFAAANEYDKLVSAIGAKNTNAYTWVEQTVYLNDIPSNELERWFQLEAERFRRPVLRLFHTELETVFEEFNISQDLDFRKTSKAMQAVLTPTHPYGTQTTLGRGEDLKNPSQTKIYQFFDQHYIPNNMAIVLAGDFDPDHALQLAHRFFGNFQEKPRPTFHFQPQPELSERTVREVWGNEPQWVEIGWRLNGAKSEQTSLLAVVAGMLYNQQAGLFDLHLLQKQRVLEAVAYPRIHEDYCGLNLFAKPREHQTLQEVEQLLLAEVQKLATGDFEDWLPQAVVRDMQLSELKEFEKNEGRASALSNAFILGIDWQEMLQRRQNLESIQKQDIIDFAKKWLRTDNYCVVFKHHGEDPNVMKVEKPNITPIEVNRSDASDFAQAFLKIETPEIEPQFVDYQKVISKKKFADGVQLHAIHAPESKLFRLFFIFEMGKNADPHLKLAARYLHFLGTSKHSAQRVQQEFYKLGVHFSAECQDECMFLSLLGLPASLDAGLNLVYELLADCQPDAAALQNMVADVLQKRTNEKMEKQTILRQGLVNFAKFGSKNPFNTRLSETELKNLNPEKLIQIIRGLLQTQHTIFYHGALKSGEILKILKKNQPITTTPRQKPLPNQRFHEKSNRQNEVFFVHFPMVQVELLLLSRGSRGFQLDEFTISEWYNQYFGSGLSSIVFQEIRESKALAYHAYAYFSNPVKKQYSHFLAAYVSTQPDKLHSAVDAFEQILNEMPISAQQMEYARQSVIKQIAADRVRLDQIYWNWRTTRTRGYHHDLRRDVFERMKNATHDDLIAFQQQKIKGRKFNWLVMGERERIDFQYLRKIGKVRELTLEEIFGF